MHPGCTYTMNKRYSTVSLEASDWNESCCCMLEKYEDFHTRSKQADNGEKLTYLVLDSYSPGGKISHSFSPIVLAVKSLGTMSDDIILWDADRVGGAVLKFECLQNDTAAVFLDVGKQMLLFGDETVKTSPETVSESSGKPSEGQLLKVKEVLANSVRKSVLQVLL
ncbi:hypothetical protein PR048_005732 [Dryococelus australis]|uniref:Uncharacterized protein n=1 Tax=Dryococelus australis TaxID=614101 RepID=A0ABQ9I924_9NEOP|nr:hypothetical protein PR048_005732 [Dryococelus australis]